LLLLQVVDYLAHLTIRVYMDFVRKQQGLGLRLKTLASRLPAGHLAGLTTPQLQPVSNAAGTIHPNGKWLLARGQALATSENPKLRQTVPRETMGTKLPVVVVPNFRQLQQQAHAKSADGTSTGMAVLEDGALVGSLTARVQAAVSASRKKCKSGLAGERPGDGALGEEQQWVGLSGWAGDLGEGEEQLQYHQLVMDAGCVANRNGPAVKWHGMEHDSCEEMGRQGGEGSGGAERIGKTRGPSAGANRTAPADGNLGVKMDKSEEPATTATRLQSGRSVRSGKSTCMGQEGAAENFSEVGSSTVLDDCASWEDL
jgi:hypothetical protein